jgi:adenylate cyclase
VSRQVEELERLARLRRFLAPQLAQLIASDQHEQALESHRREVTVVFCDLRGFTAFSETTEPEEVMRVLHEFHVTMGELIHQYEGTLERFAGDGMMIFFNDPIPCSDPSERAIHMAVSMRTRVRELKDKWHRRGHQLDFGVGISQGYATLGKIGFEGRFDYAAIGTVTNLASRLCDEADGEQILVSPRVYSAVEVLVDAETVGELSLKGFSRPILVFNIIGLRGIPSH